MEPQFLLELKKKFLVQQVVLLLLQEHAAKYTVQVPFSKKNSRWVKLQWVRQKVAQTTLSPESKPLNFFMNTNANG